MKPESVDRDNPREISVIIPAHNEEAVIGECLSSLLAVDYPPEKYQVIVVNDGSTDSTESIIRGFTERYQNVLLLSKKNEGRGAAINLGLKHAKGELVLTTDADAIVPRDWLQRMAVELQQADVVSGACYLSSIHSPLERIQTSQYLVLFKYHGFRGTPRTGVNMGLRKAVAEILGGFSETVKSVAPEFMKRAKKAGFQIRLYPDIVVQTRGTSSFTGFIIQKLRWREYPLNILKRETKLYWSDIIEIGYTHVLSLVLFVFTVAAIASLNFRYFLVPFIVILLLDIVLYYKPLWRMLRSRVDTGYVLYFLAYSLLVMLVRLALIPYLVYRLIKGTKPAFEAKRI